MNQNACFAAMLVCASVASAHAVPITALINTGSAASGVLDTNYLLTVERGGTRLTERYGYVSHRGLWDQTPWLANSAASKWIVPASDAWTSYDGASDGIYRYSLSFDLSGYRADSAWFTGRFSADNAAQVFLNGRLLATGSDFSRWTSFGADGGFNDGVNVLEFVVTNYRLSAGNPTGLRVEYLGTYIEPAVRHQLALRPAAFEVPEPGSAAVFMGGLGLIGMISRRRRRG
jgi:hypothetical protein